MANWTALEVELISTLKRISDANDDVNMIIAGDPKHVELVKERKRKRLDDEIALGKKLVHRIQNDEGKESVG